MNKKELFIRESYIQHIRQLHPDAKSNWGKMNVHQMIEHMADAFRMANGKDIYTGILTPEEKLPRAQAFILSDLPFKENTKNVLMAETPGPVKFEKMDDSINELEMEINDFFSRWESNKEQILRNPFFGDLNYEHWISLLYKHCLHHLNQFGVHP